MCLSAKQANNQLPHSPSCYESKPNSASLSVWAEPSSGNHCLEYDTIHHFLSAEFHRVMFEPLSQALGPQQRIERRQPPLGTCRERVETCWVGITCLYPSSVCIAQRLVYLTKEFSQLSSDYVNTIFQKFGKLSFKIVCIISPTITQHFKNWEFLILPVTFSLHMSNYSIHL